MQAVVQTGKNAACGQTRIRILLKAAEGSRDKDIIDALNVSPSMVAETRQRYVEERPESALKDHPRPDKAPENSPISIQLISLQWPAAMRPLPNFFNGIPDPRRRSTISVLRCARYRR
ncbi:MAG: helix-turn-helix domain-containing protein [Nitrosomonas sp.]|nr:helix-turn-helix domain-containing protein [Nitrosomonas sp.]